MLLHQFLVPVLFSDTAWTEHNIDVGETQLIRQQFYHMSIVKLNYLNCSYVCFQLPVALCVGGKITPRFCTDMRKVSAVIKPD